MSENYPLASPEGWVTVRASSCSDNGSGFCVSCPTVHPIAKDDLASFAARESAATRVEPKPIKNEHPHIADLVIEDINGRKAFGLKKYGTALQPHNGRDALADAYQEALDLCKYLRQCIYERDGK